MLGWSLLIITILFLWCLLSEKGTRLLLTTAAHQFNGQAKQVHGSLWRGVSIEQLDLNSSGVKVKATHLRLVVNWTALSQQRLHVRDLSIKKLYIEHTEQPESPPFDLDHLPKPFLGLRIDQLAIDEFSLLQNKQSLPVGLHHFQAALNWDGHQAHFLLKNLQLDHRLAQTRLQGKFTLQAWGKPWPFESYLMAIAEQINPEASPYLGALLKKQLGLENSAHLSHLNSNKVVLNTLMKGSLEAFSLSVKGHGAGLKLTGKAELAPRAFFPLRQAEIDLNLPNDASVYAQLNWLNEPALQGTIDRVGGRLISKKLNLASFTNHALPASLLNVETNFDFEWFNQQVLKKAALNIVLNKGSQWNQNALEGTVKLDTERVSSVSVPVVPVWEQFHIKIAEADLKLGPNKLRLQANWNASQGKLLVDAHVPRFEAFLPEISGYGSLKAKLVGTPNHHEGDLKLSYLHTPADLSKPITAKANLVFSGAWGESTNQQSSLPLNSWKARLSKLAISYSQFDLALARPMSIKFSPHSSPFQWELGASRILLSLASKEQLAIEHTHSQIGKGAWSTVGKINNMTMTPALVRQVLDTFDLNSKASSNQPMAVNSTVPESSRKIVLDALWNLKFAGALSGQARLERRSGDLFIPGDPALPLGLHKLSIDIQATPTASSYSRVLASLDLSSKKMGTIKGKLATNLNINQYGGIQVNKMQPVQVNLDAAIADLSALELLTGDAIEWGGELSAHVQANGIPGGVWNANGTVQGTKLRLIRIDDGVRLIDGTLSMRLKDDKVILDSLKFPSVLRVMPKEWRTREWITQNPDAKNGYIEAKGEWNLQQAASLVHVKLYRFPALQRSDRYAMVSGNLEIHTELPMMNIQGELTADAGWISLDILQSVPTLDDDVWVKTLDTDHSHHSDSSLQLGLNLKYDLGPRFYITGMGIDAGLVGNIQIQLNEGRFTGAGALRTRGGRIEAYGQKLQLRRGSLTFQNELDNPILNIEALRTGEQVEAGVRVTGTAQRPRIDLVSYPAVSEVEKLSWLLLGRGPDASGSDTALLLSIGTALIGGGEPFYKQFGLDDVGIHSGTIGTSSTLLPNTTVASEINRNSENNLDTQFLAASKKISEHITLSLEQAMASAETVARASYRISRQWSADLKAGSVNGLDLIYRTFFQD